MRQLHEFIHSFDFLRMKPDRTIIHSGLPGELSAWALVEPGRAVALYLHGDPKSQREQEWRVNLKLDLPGGPYQVAWMDVLTGEWSGTDAISDGTLTVQSPPFLSDIALKVVRR
jgi:hypothetical protein